MLAAAVMVAIGLLAARLAVRQAVPVTVSSTVDRMAATADVLRLSHYTSEVVQDGQVRQRGEYQAALEDIRQLRRDWASIRRWLPADEAARVDRMLSRLEAQVRQLHSAQEVGATVDQLIEKLDVLRRLHAP